LFVLADAAGRMFTNGSDPERAELDDASGRIGASQIRELGRVHRHRSSGKWLAQ
jgi:hypothetical protein